MPSVTETSKPRAHSQPVELKQRLETLKRQPISFIASQRFGEDNLAPTQPLVAQVEAGEEVASTMGGEGLPPHLRRMCSTPLLSPEEEYEFFLRMNYCKYHAASILASINPNRPARKKLEEAEDYLKRAERLRNYLLKANTRLVVSIARKFADTRNSFDDLLSAGLTSLVRAVEKFDGERGFRFSTYATCAVRRDLNRMVNNRRRDSQRFAATPADVLESVAEDEFQHPEQAVARWQTLSKILDDMMERLDDREKQIIRARFGFDDEEGKTSFSSLGKRMGISKERVRQLANRALDKLREHEGMQQLQAFS